MQLSNLSVDQGGNGILHHTLSRASDNNGQAVILIVYGPGRVWLSGPGVQLRNACTGEYLAIVPPGETMLSVVVVRPDPHLPGRGQ